MPRQERKPISGWGRSQFEMSLALPIGPLETPLFIIGRFGKQLSQSSEVIVLPRLPREIHFEDVRLAFSLALSAFGFDILPQPRRIENFEVFPACAISGHYACGVGAGGNATPRLKTSARGPAASPRTCSGAM